MASDQEKIIIVDQGIPMLPDLGSSDRASAGVGGSGSGSGSGWSVNIGNPGGRGAGPSGSGLGPGRGRRRGITNKQARRLYNQRQTAQAKAQAEAQALAARQAAEHAAAQARAEAEAQARLQAQAHAEAVERARIEAAARAQAARQQAYQNLFQTLNSEYPAVSSGLAHRHSAALASLPAAVQREIDVGMERVSVGPTSEELQRQIVEEKAQINLLLAAKQAALDSQTRLLSGFPHQRLLESTPEQYRRFLDSHSGGDPDRLRAANDSWLAALNKTYDTVLLAESKTLLEEKNNALSIRHAEATLALRESRENAKQAAYGRDTHLDTLWATAYPASAAPPTPRSQKIAGDIGKRYFVEAAAKRLGRSLGVLLATFPRQLGVAELPAAVLATPVSQLDLPAHLDLEYVASTKGTIDVPHRLVTENSETTARWVSADGVKIGTKVRVRTFTYNSQNNTYEFIRDGESTPALVWTPIAGPIDSSTFKPDENLEKSKDLGIASDVKNPDHINHPDLSTPETDYILTFPTNSGLEPIYIVFNTRIGDHRYHTKPSFLPAFPNAKEGKAKTPIKGGSGLRPRWVDPDGYILEWDSRHGAIEKYTKRGKHLGEFNHETGKQTKPADPTRKIEP